MAQRDAAVSLGFAAGAARLATRNIRFTVLACVVLICGCFAAAAVLQMRADRVHALAQAQYFEARRAGRRRGGGGRGAGPPRGLGRSFADGKTVDGAADGVRNITVFDSTGLALTTRDSLESPSLPLDAITSGRPGVYAPGTLTLPYGNRIVAVAFDPHVLVPARMLARAALTLKGGGVLLQDARWSGAGGTVPVAGWPVSVRAAVDEDAALAAWTGALPLYLFVILGPALVGAALAAIFVREFERRARASEAIRSLRATRPVEAKLLVRLAEAERRAVEDARAKTEFIAHMSHELRTPLNAIIGFSEVIERGFYGTVGHAKYVEYAHDINEAGRNLHNKIGDILEFANVEAGRYPLVPAASTSRCHRGGVRRRARGPRLLAPHRAGARLRARRGGAGRQARGGAHPVRADQQCPRLYARGRAGAGRRAGGRGRHRGAGDRQRSRFYPRGSRESRRAVPPLRPAGVGDRAPAWGSPSRCRWRGGWAGR